MAHKKILYSFFIFFFFAACAQKKVNETAQPAPKQVMAVVAAADNPTTKANKIFSAGFHLWQEGAFTAAVASFKSGLDIDPINIVAKYYLANSLLRLNDVPDAKRYFQEVIDSGKNTIEVCKSKFALKKLAQKEFVKAPDWGMESWYDKGRCK